MGELAQYAREALNLFLEEPEDEMSLRCRPTHRLLSLFAAGMTAVRTRKDIERAKGVLIP